MENLIENNFDIFQKRAALAPSMWYNGIKSQCNLGCELQAKEGVLVRLQTNEQYRKRHQL
jgi:hypothetical protein